MVVKSFKRGAEQVKRGKEKAAQEATALKKRYGSSSKDDIASVKSGAHFRNDGGMEGLAAKGSHVRGAWQRDAEMEGKSVLGMAGGHAVRGAAWGAVGGGTIESMQGGDFFDGAKQGAVNGAVGWTGYRMAMRGTGAKSLNPFAKGNAAGEGQGLFSAASNVSRAYSKDPEVARSAQKILSLRQSEAATQSATINRKSRAVAEKKKNKG